MVNSFVLWAQLLRKLGQPAVVAAEMPMIYAFHIFDNSSVEGIGQSLDDESWNGCFEPHQTRFLGWG